jgi:hypothetical protein
VWTNQISAALLVTLESDMVATLQNLDLGFRVVISSVEGKNGKLYKAKQC